MGYPIGGSRRGGRRGGFTLLELAIAIAVMTIGLSAAFASQLTALNLLRTTRETATATADLQALMEEVRATMPRDQVVVAYPPGVPVPAYTDRNFTNQRLVCTYPNWAPPAALPQMLQIVITATWDDYAGRPRTLIMRSARAR